jgi:hypothetical protein
MVTVQKIVGIIKNDDELSEYANANLMYIYKEDLLRNIM